MENKTIEFSVDPMEYQLRLAMDLPNNTPKAAKKLIHEITRHRDFLLEQNKLYKNSSTREIESTPEDITAYMKELEGEIEVLQKEVSIINSEEMENEEKIAQLQKENEELQKELNSWRIDNNENENRLLNASREVMIKMKEEIDELKSEMDIEHTRYVEEGVKRANTMFAIAEVIDNEYDYQGGEDELIDMIKKLTSS